MNVLDGVFDPSGLLFWFLFLFLIIWPVIQQHSVRAARLSIIRRIEQKYGYRVITLIHRQETVGFLNIPIYRYISIEDSEAVIRAIRSTPPNMPIMLVLHTPGGLVLAASQIAYALKRHPAKKIAVVPHYAMSGGTLIALASDEIWMDPDAVLGPLDPQLSMGGTSLPAPSILRAVKEKGVDKVDDETLIMADVAEKSIRQVREMVVSLLADKLGKEKAEQVAEELVSGKYTHDYPLSAEQLQRLGLNIKMEVPPEVYALMELYPQAQIQRPGVEYLPHPVIPVKPRAPGTTAPSSA